MNQTAAVAPKKPNSKAEVRTVELELKQMQSRLIDALPSTIPVRQFITTVLTACTLEPKLLTVDRRSLFMACMKSARDGLLPDGREAALVPFRDNDAGNQVATYIPMYAGLLKKVRNSGELASLSANAVYDNDVFEYELGDDERIVHKPAFGKPRGKIIAAYAIARTKSGGIYRRVLGTDDIKLLKAFSKAKKGPWHGDFEAEMWVKSAIRKLAKILPQSTDINAYISNGPAIPATDADLILPDGAGTPEAAEGAAYELKTRAILALNEQSNDLDTLTGNWTGIQSEYEKIGIDVPVDVEDVYQMRKEAFQEKPKA